MILPNDTLVCDTARLAYWQADPRYDYNRELVQSDISLTEWLDYWFMRLLRALFGNQFAEKYSELIFVLIFIAVILLLLWFLYKKRPELFMRSRKVAGKYTVHEDNIYGVDFDREIAAALSRNDYNAAVRFVYLQTLKHLSDNSFIDWQLYKTPTEYIYELKAEALRPVFRELTNRFLRVRYGNYEANRELFDQMQALQQQLTKGGEV